MWQFLLPSILSVVTSSIHKPNLYLWLEQNSYICGLPTEDGGPHFLLPNESKQFACDCGDPLISKAACARMNTGSPSCHRIPELCLREYAILFTATADRLSQPLTTRVTTTTIEPSVGTVIADATPIHPRRRSLSPVPRTIAKTNTTTFQNRSLLARQPSRSRDSTLPPSRLQMSWGFPSASIGQIQSSKNSSSSSTSSSPFSRPMRISQEKTATFTAENLTSESTTTTTTNGAPSTKSSKSSSFTSTATTTTANIKLSRRITTRTIPTTTASTAVKFTTVISRNLGNRRTLTSTRETTHNPVTTVMTLIQSTESTTSTSANNVLDSTTTIKTNPLISELSSRMRSLRDNEPEHPFIDLQDFFLTEEKRQKRIKDGNSSTAKPSIIDGTGILEATEGGVVRKPKTLSAEVIPAQNTKNTLVEMDTVDHAEKGSLVIHSTTVDSLAKDSEKAKEETNMITMSDGSDEGEKNDGTKNKSLIHFDSIITSKMFPIHNSMLPKVDGDFEARTFSTDKARAAFSSNEDAIAFLKAEIKELEMQIMRELQRTVPNNKDDEDSSDPFASDGEVMDIRTRPLLESHRRNALNEEYEDNFLNSLENFNFQDELAANLLDSGEEQHGGAERWRSTAANDIRSLSSSESQDWNSLEVTAGTHTLQPASFQSSSFLLPIINARIW